uniref:Uncharacterized protein n=1 Tax=Oryza sativa subsp. japonica TaxID=39947 RepID=Q69JV1_ORYSJ|nr:hypothetical protein [Oryza sativa Japonica Group]
MPPASSAPTVSAAVSSAGEPPMVKEWLRLLGHLVTGCSPRQRCLGKLRGRAVDAGQGHVLVDLLAAAAAWLLAAIDLVGCLVDQSEKEVKVAGVSLSFLFFSSRPYTGSTATPSAAGDVTDGDHELCRIGVVRHHVAELKPNDEAAGHECGDLDEQHELTLLLPLRHRPLLESPLHTGSVIIVVLPPPPPIRSMLAPYLYPPLP